MYLESFTKEKCPRSQSAYPVQTLSEGGGTGRYGKIRKIGIFHPDSPGSQKTAIIHAVLSSVSGRVPGPIR
jgi:hypothetical protein